MLAKIDIQLGLEEFLELSMRQGRSAFELAITRGWQREQVADLKRERDLMYSEMLRNQPRVLPGVAETLESLHGHSRMAVVTSSHRPHFDLMHANTGLTKYFEFVLTREDFGETKPSPEPYLLALKRLGMKAEKCIAVEDSERGLASARAAGLRCVVIPNEITCKCSFAGASAILPGAASVIETLAGLYQLG